MKIHFDLQLASDGDLIVDRVKLTGRAEEQTFRDLTAAIEGLVREHVGEVVVDRQDR